MRSANRRSRWATRPASGRKSSPRHFAMRPTRQPGCFVAGDVGSAAPRRCRRWRRGAAPMPVAEIDAPADLRRRAAALHSRAAGRCTARAPDRWSGSRRRGRADGRRVRVMGGPVPHCAGEVAAIVTAPLHKEALAAAGCAFPGHTEMLQAGAAAHLRCASAGAAGAHDAGQRRIADRAGQHPHVLARCHRGRDCRQRARRRCAITHAALARAARPAATHRGGRTQSPCRRRRLVRREEIATSFAGDCAARAEGIDATGRMHPTRCSCGRARPSGSTRRIRCGRRDVPRPGPDSGQVPGRRQRRQRHARACRWCAPARTMARHSISRAPGGPTRPA